jgi:hypothetical protein
LTRQRWIVSTDHFRRFAVISNAGSADWEPFRKKSQLIL